MTLYEFLVPIILAVPAVAGILWMRHSARATERTLQELRVRTDDRR